MINEAAALTASKDPAAADAAELGEGSPCPARSGQCRDPWQGLVTWAPRAQSPGVSSSPSPPRDTEASRGFRGARGGGSWAGQ